MMMPHRTPSVHHTDKLLPYGTGKESSIHKKCCSGGKRNYFLGTWLVFTMKILIFKGLQELQKHILRNKESYPYSSPLSHSYYLFPKAFWFF